MMLIIMILLKKIKLNLLMQIQFQKEIQKIIKTL